MKYILMTLWNDDTAQDLVEYSLLVAFIISATTALMLANSGSVEGILFVTTTNLNAANHAAS